MPYAVPVKNIKETYILKVVMFRHEKNVYVKNRGTMRVTNYEESYSKENDGEDIDRLVFCFFDIGRVNTDFLIVLLQSS